MKKLYVIFLLMFSNSVICQTFEPGFIITNNLDSVSGEIRFRDDFKMSQSCHFRNSKGEIIEYFPSEILAYGSNRGFFYTSELVDSLFIQVLVSGRLSLYKGNDSFFLKKTDLPLQRLDREIETQTIDGDDAKVENTKWRGILSYFVSDCENMKVNPKSIRLTESYLTKVVVSYNECFDTKYTEYKEELPLVKVSLGVLLGISFNNINNNFSTPIGSLFTRDYSFHLLEKYQSESSAIGILLNLYFPKFSQRGSVQTGLIKTKSTLRSKLVSVFSENTSAEREITYCTDIDLNIISIPFAYQYSLPTQFFDVRILGGISYNILNQSKNAFFRNIYLPNDDLNIETLYEDYNFRNQFGLNTGISFIKEQNKFSYGLDFRLDFVPSITETVDVGVNGNLRKSSLSIVVYPN